MGRPPTITLNQVLATARRVFVAKGFEGTTLADIAAELGVTAAALLRHAKSKQELFAAAMESGEIDPPLSVLALRHRDPNDDPREALRRIAEEVVPFIADVLTTRIVVAMRANAASTSVLLPFGPHDEGSPPKKAHALLADYFRRCDAAGTMRVRDPRATALLFMSALQGYVLTHAVLKLTPAIPLDAYVDALLDLWTRGAIVVGGSGGRQSKRSADRRRGGAAAPGRSGGGALSAAKPRAKTDRPERVAGGEDGERRVTRRRPRQPRSRR